MPIEWIKENKLFAAFADVRGKIELNVRLDRKENDLPNNLVLDKSGVDVQDISIMNKTGAEKYAHLLEKNIEVVNIIKKQKFKWKDFEKEMETQNVKNISKIFKKNTIKKLMKEIDDKTSSLKLSAAEVIDLKRKVGVIQNENKEIEIQAQKMKSIEPELVMNRKDLMVMDNEEVKNRVLEIAQAYRDERKRNEKLEKTLKKAQKDISMRTHVISKIKGIEDNIRAMDNQAYSIKREFKRTRGYKETISKQEVMILKLESILKNMADDTKHLRREFKKYEEEMLENSKLKNQIKNYQTADSLERVMKKKDEIKKLEDEIYGLREQLASQRPKTAEKKEMFNKRLDIEIAYEREKSRADAVEREIEKSTQKYGREIVKLKATIEEKNAFLRSIGMLET